MKDSLQKSTASLTNLRKELDMTKAELLKILEPYDDDCEVTVSGEAITEFFEISKVEKCRVRNMVYLYMDSDPLFDGGLLKDIIEYVLEYDSSAFDSEERRELEYLVKLWEK